MLQTSEAAYSPSHVSFWPVYGFRRLRSTNWVLLAKPGLAALTKPRQEGAPQLQGSFSVPQNLQIWNYVSGRVSNCTLLRHCPLHQLQCHCKV